MSNAHEKPENHGASALDSAISAWKHRCPADEALSNVARARILARAADTQHPAAPLRMLFFPLKRLVLAGALPLVLLTAMVGYLAQQGLTSQFEGAPTPPIFVNKTGNEVVFTIANGNRAHRVYLSTVPDRFDNVPSIVTHDGAFRDGLRGGPDLVYYRID